MNKRLVRQTIAFLVYGALPILLGGALSTSLAGYDLSVAGIVALWILIFLLFLKPVAVISRNTHLLQLLGYRRYMGVTVFWLGVFHGIGYLNVYELSLISLFRDISSHYFFGALGFIFVIILGITSNDISVRLLKRNWIFVHWLAYPLLFLVLFHAALASGKTTQFFVVSVLYIVFKYGEYRVVKNRKSAKSQN